MKIKQYYLYIFLLLLLLLVDSIIFYWVMGQRLLLYAGGLIFTAGIIILVWYLSRMNFNPPYAGERPVSGEERQALEKELLVENLQSRAFRVFEPSDFTLHKWIIFIELFIIISLLILLIIRRSL